MAASRASTSKTARSTSPASQLPPTAKPTDAPPPVTLINDFAATDRRSCLLIPEAHDVPRGTYVECREPAPRAVGLQQRRPWGGGLLRAARHRGRWVHRKHHSADPARAADRSVRGNPRGLSGDPVGPDHDPGV